ncbi:Uncharacterised protein [Salmonella enterica subsp. arizonae]|uniref:Uncharacterized protein n=1 Tax=Salmonella enterica subsp. arizonae TaxID=59203 RepID=A0A447R8Q0_SALER|nr:Uncharacterised protein [Salmonella enterica subsp. arizonae]
MLKDNQKHNESVARIAPFCLSYNVHYRNFLSPIVMTSRAN